MPERPFTKKKRQAALNWPPIIEGKERTPTPTKYPEKTGKEE